MDAEGVSESLQRDCPRAQRAQEVSAFIGLHPPPFFFLISLETQEIQAIPGSSYLLGQCQSSHPALQQAFQRTQGPTGFP